METKLACQFPDTLYGVQIGTVGRKIIQGEIWRLGVPPRFMHFRMMIPGIVRDDHDAFAPLPAPLLKEFHEVPEALPVKSIGLARRDELAVAQTHRPKVSDALASGVVQDGGVAIFGRHPHAAPGAVLLKMDFVQCP